MVVTAPNSETQRIEATRQTHVKTLAYRRSVHASGRRQRRSSGRRHHRQRLATDSHRESRPHCTRSRLPHRPQFHGLHNGQARADTRQVSQRPTQRPAPQRIASPFLSPRTVVNIRAGGLGVVLGGLQEHVGYAGGGPLDRLARQLVVDNRKGRRNHGCVGVAVVDGIHLVKWNRAAHKVRTNGVKKRVWSGHQPEPQSERQKQELKQNKTKPRLTLRSGRA